MKDFNKALVGVIKEIDHKRQELYEDNRWTDGEYLSQLVVKLAALNGFLGEHIAQLGYESKTLEASYKVDREGIKLEKIEGGATASKADSEKIVATADKLEEANRASYKYDVLRIKRQDTSELISAIQSRLGYLRNEKFEARETT